MMAMSVPPTPVTMLLAASIRQCAVMITMLVLMIHVIPKQDVVTPLLTVTITMLVQMICVPTTLDVNIL
jgi:hypothetical protein